MSKPKLGYVFTDCNDWLVQVPNSSSPWGFYLADNFQSWEGGFGICSSFTLRNESEVPEKVKESLGWILDEYKEREEGGEP